MTSLQGETPSRSPAPVCAAAGTSNKEVVKHILSLYASLLITMAKFLKQFKHLKGKKHEHTIKDTEKSSDNDKQGKNPAPTSTKKLDLDSLLQQDNQMRSKKMQHYRWFHKGVNRKRAEVALCKGMICCINCSV